MQSVGVLVESRATRAILITKAEFLLELLLIALELRHRQLLSINQHVRTRHPRHSCKPIYFGRFGCVPGALDQQPLFGA